MEKKLYLLTQNMNKGYDSYDSCVVCAKNVRDARKISPNGLKWDGSNDFGGSWCIASKVEVELIGIADKKIKENTLICSSFNAG